MAAGTPFDLKSDSASNILRSALHDRTVGAIVGSALGDAIGLYTEFLPADQAAIATLLAYLHTASVGGANPLPTPSDFAVRLRIWVQQGLRALDTMPLGLGRLVGTVVAKKDFTEAPERVSQEYWQHTGRRVAPNGSLMRTHPLGLMCLFRSEEETFALAAWISRVTHYDPRCVFSCLFGTALVRAVARSKILTEDDIDLLLRKVVGWYAEQPEVEAESLELDLAEPEKHVKAESLDELRLDQHEAIGYVYKTLGSGVVLLRMAIKKTRECHGSLLVRAACALLGAFLGYGALPDHWTHGLHHEKWLMDKAEALCRVIGLADGSYDGTEDKDTHLDGGRGFVSQSEMKGRWMVLQQAASKKLDEASKKAPSKPSSRWSTFWKGNSEQ